MTLSTTLRRHLAAGAAALLALAPAAHAGKARDRQLAPKLAQAISAGTRPIAAHAIKLRSVRPLSIQVSPDVALDFVRFEARTSAGVRVGTAVVSRPRTLARVAGVPKTTVSSVVSWPK